MFGTVYKIVIEDTVIIIVIIIISIMPLTYVPSSA